MLWVLKRTTSMKQFFLESKTYVQTDGVENIYNFTLKNFVYLNLCSNQVALDEAGRTDPFRPQKMATQAHQLFRHQTRVSPSPAGPAGRCPLNFLYLINLKF